MARSAAATRPVTLHLGVQKTASTALHHLLERNAAFLAPRLMVRTPVMGTPTQRMGRAAVNFSLDPGPKTEAALVDVIRELRAEIDASPLPVLISHENLPGAMIGNAGETRLYPQIERILGLLRTHLAPCTPRFAFYTREMGAWKKSVYNQAVKTDGYAGTRADFLAETAACGTWAELEARAVAVAGRENVAFFALEDEPDPARAGQQLLAWAGLGEAEIAALDPVPWRSNQSLNPGSLEFLRRVNGAGLNPKARGAVARLVTKSQDLFADAPPVGAEARE